MSKELLQQAIDALEGVLDDAKDLRNASISGGLYEVVQCRSAITALRAAIAQPASEPAGQLCEEAFGRGQVIWFNKPIDGSMLYTSPPIAQPVQPVPQDVREPVACAWAVRRTDGSLQLFFVEEGARRESECGMWCNPVIPLYTAPPQAAQPDVQQADIEHVIITLLDHGSGKYRGDASKAQREKAVHIMRAIAQPVQPKETK